MDSDPHTNPDPDPADQNQCGFMRIPIQNTDFGSHSFHYGVGLDLAFYLDADPDNPDLALSVLKLNFKALHFLLIELKVSRF